MSALTVLRTMSKCPAPPSSPPVVDEAMCLVAPRAMASSALASEREIVVTVAPMAAAIFTPMWPRPPTPTTATERPVAAPHRRSGEYVVMPAQSSGAATSSSMASGIRSTKRSLTTTSCE